MVSSRFNELVRSVKWMITHKRDHPAPECKTIAIEDYSARVEFDQDTGLYRGEFLGLSGGADFYAKDMESLITEGKLSLRVYMEACKESKQQP